MLQQPLLDGDVSAIALGHTVRRTRAECRGSYGPFVAPGSARGDALFDLASLSKPFTATLALELSHKGVLPLDVELGALAPELAATDLAPIALQDLLRHRSRLPAWWPLYHSRQEWGDGLVDFLSELYRSRPSGAVRLGTYSDLGYMLWSVLAERALTRTLAELLEEWVLRPYGLVEDVWAAENVASATPRLMERVLPCTLDTEREVELARGLGLGVELLGAPATGQVQDGNARSFARYCGHAGLFGTTSAVLRLGEIWCRSVQGRRSPLEPKLAVRALEGRGTRRLGWWRRTRRGSAGPALSRRAFGHTGFTGCSLFVDPDRGLSICLLAHRTGVDVALNPLRRRVHQRLVTLARG